MVKRGDGVFRGAGGIELSYQTWRSERETGAILGIVHGHGEHSGRYGNVVSALAPRGFAVYGFDHRGHGRSRGQRGHINSWKEYREDVRLFLRLIERSEPGRPVFLMGHSMGALVALDYLIHCPDGPRGAVISGAPIEPVGVAKPYLVYISRALSAIWPRFPLRLALDISALSRDAAAVKAYAADPLVHGRFTARWGTESLAAVKRVKAGAAAVNVPILVIHGGADRLNSPEGVERFFERMTVADKSLRVYPDMYHELHNDIGHEAVTEDIAEWLAKRI
jgi:alpha-beta hydrolase superfamily lysophospholipase